MLLYRSAAAMVFFCHLLSPTTAQTQPDSLKKPQPTVTAPSPVAAPLASKWYDKLSLRGYAQLRYNRMLESNPDLRCEQCDKAIGKNQGIAFRRARLQLSGDVHERFFVYIQFDYSADATSTSKHFMQLRDAYFDYAFDKKKEFRLRFGQSKVPYGFENTQSSSNRLTFDRSDALNSAAPNERDMGAFLYYAPKHVRARFKHLLESGLKGSGDFGVVAFGLYNGQTTNKPELNDNLHAVARLTYPFLVGKKQIIEPGLQAYTGQFTLAKDQLTTGVKTVSNLTYLDQRVGGSLVLYPQPFGIMAEYNVGQSPTFDGATDSIQVRNLHGGFVTFSYRAQLSNKSVVMPFVRFQTYAGAKKHELDARYYQVNETELGVEWQIFKNLELTLAYTLSKRQYSDLKTDYDESGRFLRLQLQANY